MAGGGGGETFGKGLLWLALQLLLFYVKSSWFWRNLCRKEPKYDLGLETRRGNSNRAFREPKRAPLGPRIASQCVLRLA
jgi:hypothetical protein